MIIELRNVQYFAAGSDETNCFVASVYVDGKKAGKVSNDGHGGPDDFDFDTTALEAHARTLPPVKCDWAEGGEMAMDLELLVGELFDKWLADREYKRLVKGRTVFHLKGDPKDEFRTVKAPFEPGIRARMVAKYGDKIDYFLNERSSL